MAVPRPVLLALLGLALIASVFLVTRSGSNESVSGPARAGAKPFAAPTAARPAHAPKPAPRKVAPSTPKRHAAPAKPAKPVAKHPKPATKPGDHFVQAIHHLCNMGTKTLGGDYFRIFSGPALTKWLFAKEFSAGAHG